MHRIQALLLFGFFIFSLTAQSQNFYGGTDLQKPAVFNTHKSACHPTDSFDLVDEWPLGIAYDGSHFWVTSDRASILKYDTLGNIVDSIPAPLSTTLGANNNLSGIDADGQFLWTIAEQQDSIYKIDKTNGNIVHRMKCSLNFDGLGICKMGPKLFATRYPTGDVLQIDTMTGATIDTLAKYPTNNQFLLGMKDFRGALYCIGYDYQGSNNNIIVKIDTATGNAQSVINVCIPYPTGLTIKDHTLWMLSSEKTISGNERAYEIDDLSQLTISLAEKKSKSDYSIFPNPTEQGFTVESSNLKISEVQLYSLDGNSVWNAQVNAHKFRFSDHLETGLYLLQLRLEDGTIRFDKLISQ